MFFLFRDVVAPRTGGLRPLATQRCPCGRERCRLQRWGREVTAPGRGHPSLPPPGRAPPRPPPLTWRSRFLQCLPRFVPPFLSAVGESPRRRSRARIHTWPRVYISEVFTWAVLKVVLTVSCGLRDMLSEANSVRCVDVCLFCRASWVGAHLERAGGGAGRGP